MKGFTPFDAGAAAPAMAGTALIAGPGLGKGRIVPCSVRDDVRLRDVHKGRIKRDIRIAIERVVLHRLESIDEARPAIGMMKWSPPCTAVATASALRAAATPKEMASMMALRFGTTVAFIVSSA